MTPSSETQTADAAATDAAAPEAVDREPGGRARLLIEALKIFADKGYTKASTREICHAAGMNVAAIHYHFGGKEGLYRELLLAPIRDITLRFAGFDDPALSLRDALYRLLGAFMMPPQGGQQHAEIEEQMMRLHRRETVEPTFDYAQMVAEHIRVHHDALAALLARHTGWPAADDRMQHLAFALVGLAQECALQRGLVRELAPALLNAPDAAQQSLTRLVDWSCAMVEHERRQAGNGSTAPSAPVSTRS